MGKVVAGQIKINTKKLKARGSDCFEELQSFMACMAKSGFDIDERCAVERRALLECGTAAARKPKVINTINYHLQRISRLMK